MRLPPTLNKAPYNQAFDRLTRNQFISTPQTHLIEVHSPHVHVERPSFVPSGLLYRDRDLAQARREEASRSRAVKRQASIFTA